MSEITIYIRYRSKTFHKICRARRPSQCKIEIKNFRSTRKKKLPKYHFHQQERENFKDMGVFDFQDFWWITEKIFKSYEWSKVSITKLKRMLEEAEEDQEVKERQLRWICKFENELNCQK